MLIFDNAARVIYKPSGGYVTYGHSYREAVTLWRSIDAYIRQYTDVIGSDNGMSPVQHQAVTWTNVGSFWWKLNQIAKSFIKIN